MNYNRVFIVAELSANHNGSKDVALKTIRAAKGPEQTQSNFRRTQLIR